MVVPNNAGLDPRHTAPAERAEIISSDNERIGRVKESESGHFKVDVRLGRDYWLSCALIREHQPDRVTLSIPRDLVASYKLRRTGRGFEPTVGGAEAKVADSGRPDL